MAFCSKCGEEITDDADICISCGCATSKYTKNEGKTLGILAIIFGGLGGWFGLLFGIIGLSYYKKPENRRN